MNDLEMTWRNDGFAPSPPAGPFVPSFAQVYLKPDGDGVICRVAVRAEHCNGFGTVHGGFLATMADVFLGTNIARRLGPGVAFVTTNLAVDYLRTVSAGQWLESQIDRVKMGGRLCYISGVIVANGQEAVAIRATFAVLEPPPVKP